MRGCLQISRIHKSPFLEKGLLKFKQNISDLLEDKLDEKLKPVPKTLSQHTAALTELITEKKKKDDNKLVANNRLDYLEKWPKQVSQKFGIEFRP